MTDELYFGVPVRLSEDPSLRARYWEPCGKTKEKAIVVIWPQAVRGKPFLKLVSMKAVRISDNPAEPPAMPGWARAQEGLYGQS